jgi:hypothetical protein
MNVEKFFKAMFSETADVDYFPPESQSLMEEPASRTTTMFNRSGFDDDALISSEEQHKHIRLSTTNVNDASGCSDRLPGLTDGYQSWTQSYDAVHQGIFHTLLYFTVGVVAYSYLLNTQWPIVDSLYFSVVIFTTGE